MTVRFTKKLDTLNETLGALDGFDPRSLSEEMGRCASSAAVAVGSGGSLVAAQYFNRCLESLGTGPASVQTPMEVVVGATDLVNAVVWLFSASAENSDIAAAARAATDRGCAQLVLCTRNADGSVADWVRSTGGTVLVVPVAEEKDGYLATHSLISTCTALLLGANHAAHAQTTDVIPKLKYRVSTQIAERSKGNYQTSFAPLAQGAVLLLISDPALRPIATLLETSLWETALCPVQLTDMRNFAHGRHTWPHHHSARTLFFALTSALSEPSWKSISDALPSDLPSWHAHYALGGRHENLCGIIDGLFWIEAIGAITGIDPGKPGIAPYGRAIYKDDALLTTASVMPPPVRQKLATALRCEGHVPSARDMHQAYVKKLDTLKSKDIGAIVLDFDGTVVATNNRLGPPPSGVVDEFTRLSALGVRIGFASGRGGSLGQQIRAVLPPKVYQDVVIGYFNGGHIARANIDLDQARPAHNPLIDQVADWLEGRPDLLKAGSVPHKEIQLTIAHDDLQAPSRFLEDVQDCPLIAEGTVRIVASGHSFDIIPATSSKLRVVEQLQQDIGATKAVLSIGDCGQIYGNDFEFLARDFGVSVDQVCPGLGGTWSLYGSLVTGPEALQKILASMMASHNGGIRFDASGLFLDSDS